ncbi:MAG: entericidin A/B family lipoprotein [Phycisphaerales bacterium]|nr:entericidin A/B family lipoprotein [Phycisphaerales bacterium]
MKKLTARLATLALIAGPVLALVMLAGCNTVKGAGQDLQNVGEAGQRVIDGD